MGLATQEHRFLDGANAPENCSSINKLQWSYNAGVYLAGAAYMYNYVSRYALPPSPERLGDYVSPLAR